MAATRMMPRDMLLALAAVAIWGSNFAIIREALTTFPPLLLATLRFAFALVPAIFLLPRPRVPWANLAGYGVLIGAGQFGLLYIAMNGRISPGLASLVIQMQVFFTIGLSVALSGERVRGVQWLALLLATAGIVVIALHVDAATTPLGLALVLAAAACWAGGNILVRANRGGNMLAYVVWASLFSVPPLLLLALAVEGWPAIRHGLGDAGWAAWGAALWQAAGNTLFGYAVWGFLLARYPAAVVSPWALLVPVFGMAASAAWLGEPLPGWKLAASALVIGGLVLGVAGPGLRRVRAARSA